jgi:hypothetical protein
MTLLFPDHAPSRFKLARAAGQTTILQERARIHHGETAGEAATRILGLLTALSAHDRRTRGHSERVRIFTDVLAGEMHLPEGARDRLRWASLLHDIGKVRVPGTVLNKSESLDNDEWEMIRRHPDQGAVLAGPLLEWLGEWGSAISQHHERYDGAGYPRGLTGHEISQAGRIVAVADTFEVMTAARSYKRPMSIASARRELADIAGKQLDPTCVRAFLGASLPRVLWAVGPLALLVNLPFLRGIAEAGKLVEHAGTAAVGQAATVAVAAVVIVAPVSSPAVVSGMHQPRAQHHTAAAAAPLSDGPGAGAAAPGGAVHEAIFREPSKTVAPIHRVKSSVRQAASPAASGSVASPETHPSHPATKPAASEATTVQVATLDIEPVADRVAFTATKPVSLGSAANYAVLAGSTITNTGASTITGSLGLSPGTAVTGVLAAMLAGDQHSADGVASQAKSDLADAYVDVAGRAATDTIAVELGGTTQTPGVYESAPGTFGITGTLTLDAKGDPDAVFIFRSASTLVTAAGSRVNLINGARAANVFWQVGSSATLGTSSVLRGNVLAVASITVTTGVTIDGRMLARTGAVTLDSDVITRPGG